MNIKNTSWDRIFRHKEPSKYPFDNVVSFFFNNVPKEKPIREINILEVGCGGANNLLFMAKEGQMYSESIQVKLRSILLKKIY